MVYEFLEHTADIKFRAYDKTIEGLFRSILLAFRDTLTSDSLEKKNLKRIEIKAQDLESLVYSFLDELIFLFDTEEIIPVDVEKISIDTTNFSLTALIWFDTSIGKEIINGVKAVTFHDLFIRREGEKWVAQIVLDV